MSTADVEMIFNVELPAMLKELMAASAPIQDQWGADIIWSANDMVKLNCELRGPALAELYMPFDHLLFIGADASGDQFGLVIDGDGHIRRNDIFRWSHECDSRVLFANDVSSYVAARQAPESDEGPESHAAASAEVTADADVDRESDADFQRRMLARITSSGRAE